MLLLLPALIAPTPPRQARQGSYRAKRGLEDKQPGHIGLLQHPVVNIWDVLEGNEDEQARQSVLLKSTADVDGLLDI